jgi:hypothetical protein
MKINELTGISLDWAVAKCEGVYSPSVDTDTDGTKRINYGGMYPEWATDWAQGGPIIEREKIRLDCAWNPGPWKGCCKIDGVTAWMEGETPLIAAMRCYVASKLGGEIELPEEITKQ